MEQKIAVSMTDGEMIYPSSAWLSSSPSPFLSRWALSSTFYEGCKFKNNDILRSFEYGTRDIFLSFLYVRTNCTARI